MNELQRYAGQLPANANADVMAKHAAADALIARLLSTPPHRYRVESEVRERLRLVASSAADVHYYAFPVKNKDGSKSEIAGPSIQLAEDIMQAAGNCGVVTTHIDVGDAWVITASFVDRENGTVLAREFRQSKFAARLKTDDKDRLLDIAFQIGQSKAIRNVIVRAMRPYAEFALEYARGAALKWVTDNAADARKRLIDRLRMQGIEPARLAPWLGRGESAWTPHDLLHAMAACKAVDERVTTWAEVLQEAEIKPPAPPAREPAQAKRQEPQPLEQGPEPEPEPKAPDDDGWPGPKA